MASNISVAATLEPTNVDHRPEPAVAVRRLLRGRRLASAHGAGGWSAADLRLAAQGGRGQIGLDVLHQLPFGVAGYRGIGGSIR